jgi:glycosyltransferase involved in cell wall biosynthesis
MTAISVTLLTRNSEKYLVEVLEALKAFDEVLVLDNGSTDRTMEIARCYTNVTLHESAFIGFGPLKNKAATLARNDWILSIDSDEIVSPELAAEIQSRKLADEMIYAIHRDNYYAGKLIECCGWGNDWVKRLYCRKKTAYNDNQVHESILETGMKVYALKGRMRHYSYENATHLVQKMHHYSTLFAQENAGKRKSSPVKAVSRALFAFFRCYILKRGWLNGYEGLLISVTNANGVFYKYIQLDEANRRLIKER